MIASFCWGHLSGYSWRRAALRRLSCAIAFLVICQAPAAAIDLDDSAAAYYEVCVAPSRDAAVPDESCDALISDGLIGIVTGELNQERPALCFPQKPVEPMETIEKEGQGLSEQSLSAASNRTRQMLAEMRGAVARYIGEHPERLSDKAIEVIFAALLHAFPCPD
jgi:hypothetical protein